MRERVRSYELVFIISPLHSGEEQVAAIIDRIHQTITSSGGEVTATNHKPPWGRRRLAYPIRAYAGGEGSRRSFTDGYYVLTHFTLPATKVVELERIIKLTDSILRYLITIVEHVPASGSEISDVEVGETEESDEDDLAKDFFADEYQEEVKDTNDL